MAHFDFGDDSTHSSPPSTGTSSSSSGGAGTSDPPLFYGDLGGSDDRDTFETDGQGAGRTWGRPPLALLAVAGGAALLALVLAATLGGNIAVAATSWLLAGPGAIGVVGVFFSKDVRQRARSLYQAPSWTASASRGVMVLIGLAVLLSAWRIADWAARR